MIFESNNVKTQTVLYCTIIMVVTIAHIVLQLDDSSTNSYN